MRRDDDAVDEVARVAARLLETGRVRDVDAAIDAAFGEVQRPATRPTAARVRRHAEGFALQHGAEVREAAVRAVWTLAEEIMTVLEEAFLDTRAVLVGRAARGHIDGGVTVYLRVYTPAATHQLAETLTNHGYAPADFMSVKSRYGRLDRLEWIEEGQAVVVTRCPPERYVDRKLDLVRGTPIVVATPAELRARLD